MPVVSMEVEFLDESRAALEANLSTRLHYRAKLQLKSRHPSDVIPWAQEVTENVAKEINKALGPIGQTTNAGVQLNLVQLEHDEALLYFDFLLGECGIQVRNVISHIYHIIKERKVFYISRSEKMDIIAAEAYEPFQKLDQDPRPCFSDPANPPVYVDRQRVERLLDESPDQGMINWRKAMTHVYGRNRNVTSRIPDGIWALMIRGHYHRGLHGKGLNLGVEELEEDKNRK